MNFPSTTLLATIRAECDARGIQINYDLHRALSAESDDYAETFTLLDDDAQARIIAQDTDDAYAYGRDEYHYPVEPSFADYTDDADVSGHGRIVLSHAGQVLIPFAGLIAAVAVVAFAVLAQSADPVPSWVWDVACFGHATYEDGSC